MSIPVERIRNFTIIAHIDHGKSTLADRLIELGGVVAHGQKAEQLLDSMSIERERGITIKAQTVRLFYKNNGEGYQLNLLDTPGHVDFSYEVSRSLGACQGSLLVVDASQGIEAQTLANWKMACDRGHVIIPVINKIDLPHANPDLVAAQLVETVGVDSDSIIYCSARTGEGVKEIFKALIDRIPPPGGNVKSPLKAMLLDSWYDNYAGVTVIAYVEDGRLESGARVKLVHSGMSYTVENLGIFRPQNTQVSELSAGEIGWMTARIKNVADSRIGDTIVDVLSTGVEPFPGFTEPRPVVFCSFYPIERDQLDALRESLEKLRLNDASFVFSQERSVALGVGFRCGFLGALHLEIIHERLQREFGMSLLATSPSVGYRVLKKDGVEIDVHNPSDMPESNAISEIFEPWVSVTIFVPEEYIGGVMDLCVQKRGVQESLDSLQGRMKLVYRLPMSEMMLDFHDKLKSASRGYASFEYQTIGDEAGDLVLLSVYLHHELVDPISTILHRSRAESYGRHICQKLKELLPRQQFPVAIQAAIGAKVIARETIPAYRKDVTAKCYGRDRTRKQKLLEKQKAGKKNMMSRQGGIEISSSVLWKVLTEK